MQIFKTKPFTRWADRAGVSDEALRSAVAEIENGLLDAELGGGLFKKRLALAGRGKRGGARTILATRFAGVIFFLYGFEKNERENLSPRELLVYRELARILLDLPKERIEDVKAIYQLTEVMQ